MCTGFLKVTFPGISVWRTQPFCFPSEIRFGSVLSLPESWPTWGSGSMRPMHTHNAGVGLSQGSTHSASRSGRTNVSHATNSLGRRWTGLPLRVSTRVSPTRSARSHGAAEVSRVCTEIPHSCECAGSPRAPLGRVQVTSATPVNISLLSTCPTSKLVGPQKRILRDLSSWNSISKSKISPGTRVIYKTGEMLRQMSTDLGFEATLLRFPAESLVS